MIKLILKLFTNSKDMTRCERGATFVYVAILLPAFIGFIGLGVDVGLWQVTKRDTQIIADASAVAGALEVMRFQVDPTEADTNQAALTAAIANGYDAAGGLDGIVINDPPVSGPYAGVGGTVEVIMTRQAPIFFSSLFRTEPVLVRSRAVAASGTGDGCIWALSPDDDPALKLAGNAEINIDCGVRVFSDADGALTCAGGQTTLDTNGHDILVTGTADDCVTPEAQPYPAGSDLLLSMDEPELDCSSDDPRKYNLVDEFVGGVLNPVLTAAGFDTNADGILNDLDVKGFFTPENYPIYATRNFSPGCYSGAITIHASDVVTFNPGLFTLDGAPFTINAGANVYGAEVMFYLNPSKTPHDVDFTGQANVSLSAPTADCDDTVWVDCGYYESILFFESRNVDVKTLTHTFAGGANMDLNGILYFSSTDVMFAGGSETDASSISIIAYTITFTGTTDIGDFPVVIDGEGAEEIVLPFNRFLVKVQLLE